MDSTLPVSVAEYMMNDYKDILADKSRDTDLTTLVVNEQESEDNTDTERRR